MSINLSKKVLFSFLIFWAIFIAVPLAFSTSLFSDVSFFLVYLIVVPFVIFVVNKLFVLKNEKNLQKIWIFGLVLPYVFIVAYFIYALKSFRAPHF
jgi:hypothetical protein